MDTRTSIIDTFILPVSSCTVASPPQNNNDSRNRIGSLRWTCAYIDSRTMLVELEKDAFARPNRGSYA